MKAFGLSALRLLLCLALPAGLSLGAASAADKPFIFPAMDGWNQMGQPHVYSPETLYEYIDGGADLYLKYDFEELTVLEYQNGQKASVTVEAYRHRNANDAFGIYSQERVPSADYLEIGAQGYYESAALNFIKGPSYVKLASDNTGAEDKGILLAFARRMAQELEGQTALPGILSAFPPEGKKRNSEKFIARDFLGYSFFHSGFTAEYEVSGKKFQLFVIEGESRDDCRAMLESYLKQIEPPGRSPAEGPFRLKDPYHKELDLFWKGNHIWGVAGLADADARAKYLRLFEEISGR